MRVPPPGSLKLDRNALLRDVREKLGERIPAYANAEDDPTDPGWLLLEQAAWMAEILSEQLDDYPFAVVQHFVHMMGGHLRPAQPALGVVVLEAAVGGTLEQNPALTPPWRFFTPQSEELRALEFVSTEPAVEIRKGAVQTYTELFDGAVAGSGERESATGAGSLVAWRTRPTRSGIFDYEQAHFTIVRNNAEELVEPLELAFEHFEKKRIGWVKLSLEKLDHDKIRVTARFSVNAAFERVAPGGMAPGGDLHVDWGTLDGAAWTPPVVIANNPQLSPQIRGGQPMPGNAEGQILIPGVPAHFPINQLLIRRPSPAPQQVVEAIWQTLVNINADLKPLNCIVTRDFHPLAFEERDEPRWVAAALQGGAWKDLCMGHQTAIHIALEPKAVRAGKLRVALVLDLDNPDDEMPAVRVYGIDEKGEMLDRPVQAELAWRLPLPPRDDRPNMVTVAALDLSLDDIHSEILLSIEGQTVGVFLNAVMVANLPSVRDGRTKVVQRNVPEGISLLHGDVVSPRVIDQLLEQPIPRDAAKRIAEFPLAYFALNSDGRGGRAQDPIWSWSGLGLDPSEGTLVLNAPDSRGERRSLRPGTRVKLNWYRRTDGAVGNVPEGTIKLIEQEPTAIPSVFSVRNPLPTTFGADREAPEAAVDRLFAPSGGTPVLPSDYERVVRLALGNRGKGWQIRCWAYAERALLSTAMWPFDDAAAPEADAEARALLQRDRAERARVEARLADAGPDHLLVALTRPDGDLSDQELDWARRVIQQQVKRLSQRLPTMGFAVVTRLHELTLHAEGSTRDLVLPSYDLRALRGELRDANGIRGRPPSALLLLNAAVTQIVARSAS